MLTPVRLQSHFATHVVVTMLASQVDYTRSSTVWAQDKWKGVFKVRWIFVRDIPNAMLRGIRLECAGSYLFGAALSDCYTQSRNTQERKPVTNSRDTQELLPDAGSEMLRIFLTHAARTSLLQDFAYYEVRASFSFPWTADAVLCAVAVDAKGSCANRW
jgi:YTH domain-containing family protein